jgi:hypothetical protein
MNCQGIARIIDSGSFGAISAADRRDAEAHAQGCRLCAPQWIIHSRLAASPVPAVPPQLSTRCLALAAPTRQAPASHRAPRTMVVVISLVTLAAAASMLGVSLSGKLAPQRESMATFTELPASSTSQASGDPAGASGQPSPAVTQAPPTSNTQRDFPLFPRPSPTLRGPAGCWCPAANGA